VRIAAWSLEAFYLGCGILLPLASLLMVAISRRWNGHFAWRAATMFHFDAIFAPGSPARAAIANSLILAVLGATIAIALAVSRRHDPIGGDRPRRASAGWLHALPPGIPGIVFGLGFLILTMHTPLQGSLGIILLAYIARFPPFAPGDAHTSFLAIDPDMEQAARAAGAGWKQRMAHIVLPLLRPSMLASWLLLLLIFIRELGTPMLLYGPGAAPISVAIATGESPGRLAALAVVQMGMLLVAFAVFMLSRSALPRRPV